MLAKTVHFIPTPANLKMVEKLRQMPPLHEVEFKPLLPAEPPINSPDKYEKLVKEALMQLSIERAVFIWGDGHQHHFSYYFDLPADGAPVFKLNIDHHEDFFYLSPDGESDLLTYFNHMTYSNQRENYVAATLMPSLHPDFQKDGKLLFGNKKSQSGIGKQTDGSKLSFPAGSSIHITIDLDAIALFPSIPEFVSSSGFGIDKIIQIIAIAKDSGRLMRLDFGGLISNIPYFDFSSDSALATRDQIRRLTAGYFFEPENKLLANSALSRALMCCYKILSAVLFD